MLDILIIAAKILLILIFLAVVLFLFFCHAGSKADNMLIKLQKKRLINL